MAPIAEARVAEPVAPLRHVHDTACYQYRVAPEPKGGAAKRALDLIIASTALILLAPLLLVIAWLIQLDSPGPALFRQHRTGFRGRAFKILKFRTMTTLENGRITQARPGDARVTRLGRLLRRTSIDELPQLINVVLGDMSIVGPRPHALQHDQAFFRVDGQYPLRFLARPGITGAAQIAGARGATETPEKVEARLRLDLSYVRSRWSLRRDLYIMICTVFVVCSGRNAY